MERIEKAKKVKRSRQIQGCSRFQQRERGGKHDVHERQGAKTRVGKFVHFSGNARVRRADKLTGNRQDTATRRLLCDRVLPIRVPSFHLEMPTVRLIWPRSPFPSSKAVTVAFIPHSLYYFRNFPPRSPAKSC